MCVCVRVCICVCFFSPMDSLTCFTSHTAVYSLTKLLANSKNQQTASGTVYRKQ